LPFDITLYTGEILDYCFGRNGDKLKLEQYMKHRLKEQVDHIKKAKGWSSKYKDIENFEPGEISWHSRTKVRGFG
jgi:superfamily I DNA and/or RNA helicase